MVEGDGTSASVFVNQGTITQTGLGIIGLVGSVFKNDASGSYLIDSGSGITNSLIVPGSFVNYGRVAKPLSGATATITAPFNNLGTVEVDRGTLQFTSVTQVAGSTLTGGNWIAAQHGKLMLPGGSLTENDGAVTLSGSGTFPQLVALASNVVLSRF